MPDKSSDERHNDDSSPSQGPTGAMVALVALVVIVLVGFITFEMFGSNSSSPKTIRFETPSSTDITQQQ